MRSVRVVGIETSSAVGSIALFEGGALVARDERRVPSGHGEHFLPMTESLFARVGWRATDVARWGVDIGPGSFTGVRVGVSLAKAIVLVTGAEIVGVTAFEALAIGLGEEDVASPGGRSRGELLVVSLLPAGKGELFVQAKASGRVVVGPAHWPVSETAGRIASLDWSGSIVIAGEASREVDWSCCAERVELAVDPPHDVPRAEAIAKIALARTPEDADGLEPVYVRPPDVTMPKRRSDAP
ncbi:MAG TPA: tRNA (adenosine(37)-N6)-threonylcarbamoyltransferase complex dimerization subunit type 1 TsaB [Polyangiaceae bacterium]|nr:tRNA (adenosine(37)-N6)-threonylcarbamoyltransferase complex dimerization subunit type 1 TsaB [Polyangiaceae bacterium]